MASRSAQSTQPPGHVLSRFDGTHPPSSVMYLCNDPEVSRKKWGFRLRGLLLIRSYLFKLSFYYSKGFISAEVEHVKSRLNKPLTQVIFKAPRQSTLVNRRSQSNAGDKEQSSHASLERA